MGITRLYHNVGIHEYCLYRTAKYERDLMCDGDGDNGKGTFLEVNERFVGKKNSSHISLQDLDEARFSIGNPYGKLVNTFTDIQSDKLTSTGNFKMLTSGDEIYADIKHKTGFFFSNFAKLIFSCNQIPQFNDLTYTYFKRWIILRFRYSFKDKDRNL